MESLNSLKKQELLDLAKEKNLPVNTKMTKDQIIELINTPSSKKVTTKSTTKKETVKDTTKKTTTKKVAKSDEKVAKPVAKPSAKKVEVSEKKSNKKETSKTAKSSKIAPPTRDIIATFDNNITILVQSHDTALIIWNADPALDNQVDSWRFTNHKGLDITVPNYARSAFVDISLLQLSEHTINFILYKIGADGTQIEHNNYYTSTFRDYSQQTQIDVPTHFEEYNKFQTRFNS